MAQLVIARDGSDPGAAERRLRHRDAHVAAADELFASGRYLFGGPLRCAGDGTVIGSLAVVNFATPAEFDDWLTNEPLMKGGVWQSTEVLDIAVHQRYVTTPVQAR